MRLRSHPRRWPQPATLEAARTASRGKGRVGEGCGAAETAVRGNTTNDMTANYLICAKAEAATAACCTATS